MDTQTAESERLKELLKQFYREDIGDEFADVAPVENVNTWTTQDMIDFARFVEKHKANESENKEAPASAVEALVSGSDGTDELCNALYGRKAKPEDYLGGSDAKMLKDAAKVVKAARKIKHWDDTGRNSEGMVVSAKHVRLLWKALPEEH
nr:hypothetical protein 39 [Balneolaceae bacterium]